LSPKRTFNQVPAKTALVLTGSAIALAAYLGASANDTGHDGRGARQTGLTAAQKHHPRRHPKHHRKHHAVKHHRARKHRARRHLGRLHANPWQIAGSLMPADHWTSWQFHYLNLLWMRESGWKRFAYNHSSGAYGIPQAVPGDKMAAAGPDWRTSARTQIIWGMGYIRSRYGDPWNAWQHELRYGWY
jgi:hypothetical protein